MIDLKVPDMHCEKCVSRIHETLEAAQISHEIDLSKKIVSVADDQVDKARSAMDVQPAHRLLSIKRENISSKMIAKSNNQ